MAYEKCMEQIAERLKRNLTDKEKKELNDRVEKIFLKFKDGPSNESLLTRALEASKEISKNEQMGLLLQKRNILLNKAARVKMEGYLLKTWGDDVAEGLNAYLGNSLVDRPGSKAGLAGAVKSNQAHYSSGLVSDLAQGEVLDLASSGKMDKEVALAMHELSMKTPNAETLAKFPAEAVKVATVFRKYIEALRSGANKAGAYIGNMEGYIVRRTHDMHKISKAAGETILSGNKAHRDAWISFVEKDLDFERSFPNQTREEAMRSLSDMFTQFSSGVHVKLGESPEVSIPGSKNFGKKLSQERVLHFNSSEAEYAYIKKFGVGDKLVETMDSSIRGMARDMAIMQRLGPNAEDNINSVVDTVKKQRIQAGDGEGAAKISKKWENFQRKLWPGITGESSIPENIDIANASGVVRNVQMMAQLGSAVLSSASDIVNYAATMRYTGERNMGSFFSGAHSAMNSVVDNFSMSKAEQKITAGELGILTDSAEISSMGDFSGVDSGGKISKLVRNAFVLNLLTPWQNGIRVGAATATAFRHTAHRHLSLDALPKGMRAYLGQFNIREKEWDIIRNSSAFTDYKGREFITPKSLEKEPLERFQSLTKSKTEVGLQAAKDSMIRDYRLLFSEVAAMASTEKGIVENSIIYQGLRPGTSPGEAIRHLMMYKSFTVTMMRKHLGRELFGYGPNRTSTPRAIANVVSEGLRSLATGDTSGGAAGIANMVVFGAMLGYVQNSVKDIAKGKKPRVPEDADSFVKIGMAAMASSGSMGILSDFLFGEVSRFGHGKLATVLGPTWGNIEEAGSVINKTILGEKDALSKGVDFALNLTPGVNTVKNLFYTKAATDYLIMHRMHEFMNPGYLKRMEKNLKNSQGQEYIIPPSSVIPRGGF